jgi:hypothetical protein
MIPEQRKFGEGHTSYNFLYMSVLMLQRFSFIKSSSCVCVCVQVSNIPVRSLTTQTCFKNLRSYPLRSSQGMQVIISGYCVINVQRPRCTVPQNKCVTHNLHNYRNLCWAFSVFFYCKWKRVRKAKQRTKHQTSKRDGKE